MVYLRSRMYDPVTGRFTTKDSWQGDYNRSLSLNRWMYVEGNPINATDPSGHLACKDVIPSWRLIFETLALCDPNEAPTLGQETMDTYQALDQWLNGNTTICGAGYTSYGYFCAPIIVRDNPCGSDVPALIPSLSQLTPSEPRYCNQLWEQWATAAVNAGNLTDLIRRARIELLETIDPVKRRYIELKILAWQRELTEVEKRIIGIKDAAKAAGCDISGWYL